MEILPRRICSSPWILNAPFLTLGDSKSAWGPFPLPLDLAFLGMLGCAAFTNSLASYALVNGAGTATWSARIPSSAGLIGRGYFLQGGVTSPGANPFGVALSNAIELRIGAR